MRRYTSKPCCAKKVTTNPTNKLFYHNLNENPKLSIKYEIVVALIVPFYFSGKYYAYKNIQ